MATVAGGCFALNWDFPTPAGSGSGGHGGFGGSMSTGGNGCVFAATCPGSDTECRKRTCFHGSCGLEFVDAGTPISVQDAGDCQIRVCDDAGGVILAVDSDDTPPGTQCTIGMCDGGVPGQVPACKEGDPCNSAGTECVDNEHCTDGVCCQSDNCGPCRKCNTAGALGQCAPVQNYDDDVCPVGFTCYAGGCKKKNGNSCMGPDECASATCSTKCELCTGIPGGPCEANNDCVSQLCYNKTCRSCDPNAAADAGASAGVCDTGYVCKPNSKTCRKLSGQPCSTSCECEMGKLCQGTCPDAGLDAGMCCQ